jgi:hypothetical protein
VDEFLHDRADLQSLPELHDRQRLLNTLESHYDGYRFSGDAKERVFNSTMVLYFFRELARRAKYPAKMLDPNARTDYGKLHGLWAAAGPAAEERRNVLEMILNDEPVWSELVEEFGTRNESTTSQFVSLMFCTGMLTMSADPPEGDQYHFETPNRVIRELAWQHYTKLLQDIEGINLTDQPVAASLRVMVKSADITPFLDVLRKNVLSVLSVKDLRRHDEKAMKMLLIGTLVTSNLFYVFSEKEFAQGFNDLFLRPLPRVPHAKYAWMLELKYLATGADDAAIDRVVVQAEAQLQRYLADGQLVKTLSEGYELKAGTLVFVGAKDVVWREMATG